MRLTLSHPIPSVVIVVMILSVAFIVDVPVWTTTAPVPNGMTSHTLQDPERDLAPPPPDVLEDEAEQPPFEPPRPTASNERIDERRAMVRSQLAAARDGRTLVRDEKVLEAMRTVPRHAFVPEARRDYAYQDSSLPIGHGQTISQPYIVGLMTELLELTPQSRVLEIGTGSAYQASVLAQLTPHVYTVEIIEALAERARETLDQQGYEAVHTRHADGYYGWAEEAPFDVIIVTCAAGHLPPPLWEQIKPGGRIVIPIGGVYEVQRLVVMTKLQDGSRRSRTVTAVRFVPMTRADTP